MLELDCNKSFADILFQVSHTASLIVAASHDLYYNEKRKKSWLKTIMLDFIWREDIMENMNMQENNNTTLIKEGVIIQYYGTAQHR